MIPDRELTASTLVAEVTALLRDPTRLYSMANAAHSLGVRDADEELAQWVLDVVRGSGKA
jgi:UDP-N-acetylglucosamine:LPS N-acetylglucosamine transferase